MPSIDRQIFVISKRIREFSDSTGSALNLLDFHRIPAHNAAMPKRVQIALAVVLVMLAGVMVWQVLRSQDRSRKEYASC